MNELITAQNTQVMQNTQQDLTKLACDYLSAMGNKCNESQQKQFINICQSFGLNPFKREIYAVKYGENFNIIVGYEVYLKRAERTGKLDGWGVRFEGQGGNMTAILTIHRKDWTNPFTYEVYLSECSSEKNLWLTKPKTMLRKTAIGQGFRLCFPDELGGLPYMAEEITGYSEEEVKAQFSVAEPVQQAQSTLAQESKTFEEKKKIDEEIKNLIKSTYPDGEEIFTDEDKASFREMYRKDKFSALASMKSLLQDRLSAWETVSKAVV